MEYPNYRNYQKLKTDGSSKKFRKINASLDIELCATISSLIILMENSYTNTDVEQYSPVAVRQIRKAA